MQAKVWDLELWETRLAATFNTAVQEMYVNNKLVLMPRPKNLVGPENKAMLAHYYGFKEDPFGVTPDPRCLYESGTHREALASLKLSYLSNRGFTALIAPPGMGKTTLLFRFLEDIQNSARTVFLFNVAPQCEPRELIAYILRDLGIHPGTSDAEMHEQLNEVLIAEARATRKFVVVIDEAQNLSESALETVRLLTNFETARAKLMQVVLAGQPQLADTLSSPSLLQLQQRISTYCKIQPLSPEEIKAYIEHRVKVAGWTGAPLFSSGAIDLITEASQGIPRTINMLCFNALSVCRALGSKCVDREMVAEAIADRQIVTNDRPVAKLADESRLESPRQINLVQFLNHRAPIALLITALAVLIFLGFSRLQILTARKPSPGSTEHLPSDSQQVKEESLAVRSTPSKPFKITVEANQTLRTISLRYLGDYDQKRLTQIQLLNPEIIDPNLIETGQTIWLPASTEAQVKRNSIPTSDRNTP